jgi:hypothetical protein
MRYLKGVLITYPRRHIWIAGTLWVYKNNLSLKALRGISACMAALKGFAVLPLGKTSRVALL